MSTVLSAWDAHYVFRVKTAQIALGALDVFTVQPLSMLRMYRGINHEKFR